MGGLPPPLARFGNFWVFVGILWKIISFRIKVFLVKFIAVLHYLGKSPKQKMSPKVEKVQKGGGSTLKIKKFKIQNLDFLIREGEPIFSFFPKCK